jgi:poly(A)-specific ribonuclease
MFTCDIRADSGPNGGAARNQIRVIRLSMSEKKQREERLLQEEWSKLVYAIGFTTVFQAISDACNGNSFSEEQTDAFFAGNSPRVSVPSDDNGRKIPLIGEFVCSVHSCEFKLSSPNLFDLCTESILVHNGLMDLMFLLTHCHDSKLPECFEDTKKLIRNYFPLVYDTKILATECSDAVVRGGSTALGELYQSMFSPEINDLGLKKSTITNGSATEQAHEAAWDAFMTGCCFYALSKKILDNKDSRLTLGRVLEHEPVGSLHRTSMGLNKLYMHFSLYTIDLESSSGTSGLHDPLCHGLTVNTTFYVSGIDSTVSTRDILRALTVTQNQTEIIQHLRYEICWVDDESFFVGTKLDNLISVRDTGAISLIAIHVRHQLRAGLRGVQVIDLADYFNQKHSSKQSLIGSITSAVKRLFGGGKRTEDDDTNERAKKRRRVN